LQQVGERRSGGRAIGPVALKTASSNFVQKKNRKKLKLQLFRANGGGGGGDAFQKDHWTLNKQRKRDGVLGESQWRSGDVETVVARCGAVPQGGPLDGRRPPRREASLLSHKEGV
jgi:hypothetical protein